MSDKKAMIPGLENLAEESVGQMFQEVATLLGGGLTSDVPTAINQAAEAIGIALTPEQIDAASTAYEEKQKEIGDQMGEEMSTMAANNSTRMVSGSRELLHTLNNVYGNEGLDFMKALRVWKEARLTPQMIKDQIHNDVQQKVSLAEAMSLHKIGTSLIMGSDPNILNNKEDASDIYQKMSTSKQMKLTPNVRATLQRVGQNLFRTKRANIYWKIDMKNTDDGQQVPYLVRIDTVVANEEDNARE